MRAVVKHIVELGERASPVEAQLGDSAERYRLCRFHPPQPHGAQDRAPRPKLARRFLPPSQVWVFERGGRTVGRLHVSYVSPDVAVIHCLQRPCGRDYRFATERLLVQAIRRCREEGAIKIILKGDGCLTLRAAAQATGLMCWRRERQGRFWRIEFYVDLYRLEHRPKPAQARPPCPQPRGEPS